MGFEEDYGSIRNKYPKRLTRGRAIKLYCKEQYCAGDNVSWKNCPMKSCFLWSFRVGKEQNPDETVLDTKNDSIHTKNKKISYNKEGPEDATRN